MYDETYCPINREDVLQANFEQTWNELEEANKEIDTTLNALAEMTDRYLDAKAALEIERERVACLRAILEDREKPVMIVAAEEIDEEARYEEMRMRCKAYCEEADCKYCVIPSDSCMAVCWTDPVKPSAYPFLRAACKEIDKIEKR